MSVNREGGLDYHVVRINATPPDGEKGAQTNDEDTAECAA